MPVILIVVGLAIVLGIGSFLLRPEEIPEAAVTEVVEVNKNEEDTVIVPEAETASESAPLVQETATNPKTPEVKEIPTTPQNTSTYSDGVHTTTTTYIAPGNAKHNVIVSLTLSDDIVSAAKVTYSGDVVDASTNYQKNFSAQYESKVIGKSLDEISLSRVGGASLTTNAFNKAISEIKSLAES